MLTQNPRSDFEYLTKLIDQGTPFTFVRFSDGEIEVLRDRKLFIGDGIVSWTKGEVHFSYPDFDRKDFTPERDQLFQNALVETAKFKAPYYFKGIPTRHNKAVEDRDFMVALNGDSLENLTFSDLLINGNFRIFRNYFDHVLSKRQKVIVFGNFRMQPSLVNNSWTLVPVQDNFIPDYEHVVGQALSSLSELPLGSLVLSSASSLTNIVGRRLRESRPDITFIDIGTSLHDLMGMTSGIREYHSQMGPFNLKKLPKLFAYYLAGGHKLKW